MLHNLSSCISLGNNDTEIKYKFATRWFIKYLQEPVLFLPHQVCYHIDDDSVKFRNLAMSSKIFDYFKLRNRAEYLRMNPWRSLMNASFFLLFKVKIHSLYITRVGYSLVYSYDKNSWARTIRVVNKWFKQWKSTFSIF